MGLLRLVPGQVRHPDSMVGLRRNDPIHASARAHRDLAGLIGFLRVCRQAGSAGPEEAWGQLARLAALRFGMARYGRYQASSGIVGMPADPAAAKELLRWGDLSRPENYIHVNVAQIDQQRVRICDGVRPVDTDTGGFHLTFMEMVPEVGRMLRDWGLADDVKRYLDFWSMRHPNWFNAYADARRGHEVRYTYASDSHQLFMAHAWIAGTAPQALERYIDVPWALLGDLYHMHKLAETIKAHRALRGKQSRR